MKIVLLGSGQLGLAALEALLLCPEVELLGIKNYLDSAVDQVAYYQDSECKSVWKSYYQKFQSIILGGNSIHQIHLQKKLIQLDCDWIILAGWPEIFSEKSTPSFSTKNSEYSSFIIACFQRS